MNLGRQQLIELKRYATLIGGHIERDSGFQRLPAELNHVRVPGIFIEHVHAGQATLFDALFDSDPANNP